MLDHAATGFCGESGSLCGRSANICTKWVGALSSNMLIICLAAFPSKEACHVSASTDIELLWDMFSGRVNMFYPRKGRSCS